MKFINKILYILTPSERRKAYLLIIIIFIMAILDMIGIASILPFIAILSDTNLIETNFYLNKLYQISSVFGINSKEKFLFAFGILILSLVIMSLFFKAITIYAQEKFLQMQEHNISKRLIEGYLHQPYSWFLNRNSSELGKDILSEVGTVVTNGIRTLIELISKGIVSILLITLLLIVDFKLAITTGFTLGISYILIFLLIRKLINRTGQNRFINNQLRFSKVSEVFGAIKEVKLRSLENVYINKFSKPSKNYSNSIATSLAVSQLPRLLLEAIAFVGIMLILLYLISNKGSFNEALPIISLYVFAGYRLMPAMQQIYSSVTQISFVRPSLDNLYSEFKNLKSSNKSESIKNLFFNHQISLKNICYSYPKTSKLVIKDITLTIPAQKTIGLIGTTGSGKTTIIDIILGLLEPVKGTLEVDNKIITKNSLKSWQKLIGYVPQHIYLLDDTIASNIAFGEEIENINLDKVSSAAKIANLHQFVSDELPKKYQTTVGERGVRLSGGQRQRIGIARALYHNPKVLILDEATSSLDNETEKAVMDAVHNLAKDITIILIAHRLNTVKNCDIIFKIDKGKIIEKGTYKKIIEKK